MDAVTTLTPGAGDDRGDLRFLNGGGETGALIRGHDWAATSLGAPEQWPGPLKTAVSLLLTSAAPVYVAWGPDLISFYNDGYLPIVGTKHPGIGLPFRELWAEIWKEFEPIVQATMEGQSQHFVDLPMALAGRPGVELGYFTFSYTPLLLEDGSVGGFYCAATETTEVLAMRRSLEQSNQRLARATGAVGIFVWETEWSDDGAGRTLWGENAAKILGVPEAELPTDPGAGSFFVAEHDRSRMAEEFAAIVAARSERHAFEFEGMDGRFWRADCVLEYDGEKLRRSVGATRDVTADVLKRRRQSFFIRLDQLLREERDVAALKASAATLVGRELGVDRVMYVAVDEGQALMAVEDGFLSEGTPTLAAAYRGRPIADLIQRYRSGQPIAEADFQRSFHFKSFQQSEGFRDLPIGALLDVPTVRAGQLRSVLSLHQLCPRAWTDFEIQLAHTAGHRIWETLDRLEAEQALRLSEAQFRSTADALPGMLFVTDAGGRNLYVNQFYRDYTGASLEDVMGDGWTVVVHPDDMDVVRSVTENSKASGDAFEGEYRIRRHDGAWRWHSTRATATRDADGRIVRWVGVSLDIHDRREAEDQVRAAAEEMEAIYATAPVGLTLLDRDLRYVRINERMAETNGVPAADHISRTVREVIPDLGDQAEAALRRVLDGEEVWGHEVTGETPAQPGVIRTWRANWLPVRGPGGQINGVAISAEEITDSKAAETALAQSEAQFRTLAEALPGMLFITRGEGGNLYVNETFARFTGRKKETLLGTGWADTLHADDVERAWTIWNESVTTGKPYQAEYRFRRHDGQYRWHTVRALRIPAEDNGEATWVGTCIDIHDQREAQEELARSEERYRTLFESMEQGFFTLNISYDDDGRPSDYRFTEINPAFSRQSGLTADVLNQSVSKVLPDLEPVWLERYGEVARTGVYQRFVDHAAPLDRWFEVYAFPIGKRADNNVAVLFTDVTERVRQEEALRLSERDMRMRLNAIPQMVWSTLPDGFHDFYNDRWYEFTGTPLGSTDGAGWNGMFHPEDQPRAWERWQRSLDTGEPYEIEYRLRHHTGTYRWVLGRALPIRDDQGSIVRWMGTCTDIDDRIEAERSLRASEARLRALFEAMPVGLVFADASGEITGGNQRVTEIIGQDVVHTETTDAYDRDYVAFHGDGRKVESHEYPLAKILAGDRGTPELECRVQRSDGSLRWVRYVAAPILEEDGTFAGGVVASLDIDREKLLTEGLEAEVHKVVAEREAAQEALRQSQKLESMGQLTGGVAHDFNNLLTPIIGSLDLLQRKQVLDERTGRLVDGALASAEKARLLVQRLLAFARRQPLQPQPIDVGRIVTEMSELIDSTSGPRVRVLTEVPSDLPPALADGNQLEMALLNLSVNARDAMPDGGTLTIGVRSEAARKNTKLGLRDRPHVVLSVSDTGAGMDEETVRRAIEPFFSTKGIGKGTGLGLSMVHGLAAQLGGALDIRSAPGMGTTIELWLPVADGAVAGGPGESAEIERHGAGIALLVDDEELVRASTAGMLADLGYRVVEADSGEAAAALVDGGLRPDILVTDQLMPGLSGTDLAVRLRDKRPDLPVLIVSGYADLESLSPAFPHLSKPFRQAELAAALEKVALAD